MHNSASQAVATAGKKDKILITGLNGVPPALRAIKAGKMDLTVDVNPVAWGRLGIDTMVEYLKGNRPGDKVAIKHQLVDATNVDKALAPK